MGCRLRRNDLDLDLADVLAMAGRMADQARAIKASMRKALGTILVRYGVSSLVAETEGRDPESRKSF